MRSIASFSSLSYSNTFEESTSHTMDLVTITKLYTRDKRSRPPKQIQVLVNRCMLFRISAKTEHLSKLDSAFPVFKINTDQQLLKQHCPEILGIPEEEVNTEMLSLEDDEILEGFLSDEADSPIATLPPLSGEAAEGSVKRSLIDEFSSTQGCRKVKQHRLTHRYVPQSSLLPFTASGSVHRPTANDQKQREAMIASDARLAAVDPLTSAAFSPPLQPSRRSEASSVAPTRDSHHQMVRKTPPDEEGKTADRNQGTIAPPPFLSQSAAVVNFAGRQPPLPIEDPPSPQHSNRQGPRSEREVIIYFYK
nr:uncharacterized protein LOC109147049 [Ipomoea trifida]